MYGLVSLLSVPVLLFASAQGKAGVTTICLGLAKALRKRGLRVGTFKTGCDAWDAVRHSWTLRQPCLNLDSWAMRFDTLLGVLQDASDGMDIVLGDGHAGLFDNEPSNLGSDADFAALLGIRVVLVVDAKDAGRSIAPMVEGLLRCRQDVEVAGIFLNSVRSAAHAAALIDAFDDCFSTPVVGYLIDDTEFEVMPYHDQAARALDADELDSIMEAVGNAIFDIAELGRLQRLAIAPNVDGLIAQARPLPVLGQRIAVAQDEAFSFGLEATMTGWHRQGAQILPFSPLADERPSAYADAVYLPPGPFGDYPEILAGRREFMKGLAASASRQATIYGEGLGYGLLSEFMLTAHGEKLAMSALLPATVKIRKPTDLSGYRHLKLHGRHQFGPPGVELRGWEADDLVEIEQRAEPLFAARSQDGGDLGQAGCYFERIAGTTIRLMDRHPHLAVVRG